MITIHQMNFMRNILLILPALTFLISGTTNSINNDKKVADHITDAATVKLVYTGIMNGYATVNVGITVEIDTSIGIRYEVNYTLGIKSHVAFFYKFSNPHQVIEYNFLTHKSYEIKGGKSSKDPEVTDLGKTTNGNYQCTHLYHENNNGKSSEDYWMSQSVPGFAQVARVLNNIDPTLKQMFINHNIFKWGGLVELQMRDETNDGQKTTFKLYLTSAQSGIPLNLDDFEVPSK